MFTRYHGQEAVKAGTYLCPQSGEFVNVEASGELLPGSGAATYFRVSPLVALIVGPFVGLVFVIFLPLAVPLLVLRLLVARLWSDGPAMLSRLLTVGQRPAAYAAEGIAEVSGLREPQEARTLEELLGDVSEDLERQPKRQ